jgi:D-3-phosphoglycerate dehydrogenase
MNLQCILIHFITGDANLLGIRSKTMLDDTFFDAISWQERRLYGVGCFCIGTNQVALHNAADAGVAVYNAPFSNTRSVVSSD